MRISTRGRYGLIAIAHIADKLRNGAEVVSTKSIADGNGISENYLEQILSALKGGGLLKSVRGAGGGYLLARPPELITAGEVLRIMEGSLSPAECLDEAADANDRKHRKGCASCDDCAAKGVLSRLYGRVTETVDSITILDILVNKSM